MQNFEKERVWIQGEKVLANLALIYMTGSEKTGFTDDGRSTDGRTDDERPRDDISSAVQQHKAELKTYNSQGSYLVSLLAPSNQCPGILPVDCNLRFMLAFFLLLLQWFLFYFNSSMKCFLCAEFFLCFILFVFLARFFCQ